MKLLKMGIVLSSLLMSTGCATWYHEVNHQPVPIPISVATSQKIVGVTLSPNSKAPSGAVVSPMQVTEQLVNRLREDGVFKDIVFPYTQSAQVKPAILLDTTVSVDQQLHMGTNLAKAILVGGTFFILTPVLPIHFGLAIDMNVASADADTGVHKVYRFKSQYEFKYWFYPKKKVYEEWIERTQEHAIEDILNQIKRDIATPSEAREEQR